jgi:hypothetical protein
VTAWAGWIFGIVSVIALILTVVTMKRNQAPRKWLVADARGGPPLARSSSLGDYRLQVVMKVDDHSEEIESAHVSYLSFVNLGRDSIRRQDIAPANPLRIRVQGAPVLSVDLERQTRNVCKVQLESQQTRPDDVTEIPVSFDYLDEQDGGLVRILTDGQPTSVELLGDIIGMPSGVEPAVPPQKSRLTKVIQGLLTLLVILVPQIGLVWYFLTLVDEPYLAIFLYVSIIVLIASGLLSVGLDALVSPRRRSKLPSSLSPRLGRAVTLTDSHMYIVGDHYDYMMLAEIKRREQEQLRAGLHRHERQHRRHREQ